MRVSRALAIGSAGVVLSVISGAGVAQAGPPTGGCPSGGHWELLGTDWVIPAIDNGNYSDQNGDGLLCATFPQGNLKHDGGWTWKDNTNP
jgi:hypothetical protein